jgi:hypothetical protein
MFLFLKSTFDNLDFFTVIYLLFSILITCPNAPECDGTLIDWRKNTKKNRNFYLN